MTKVKFKLIGLYAKSFWLEKKLTKSNETMDIRLRKFNLYSPKRISLQSRLDGTVITTICICRAFLNNPLILNLTAAAAPSFSTRATANGRTAQTDNVGRSFSKNKI